MYFTRILIFVFILLAASEAAIAQASPFPIPRADRQRTSSDPFGNDENVDRITAALNKQAEIENAAKVPKAYKEQHRLFLKTPDSGIAKLFPAESLGVLDVKTNNKNVPTETAFFSFSTRQHTREFADVKFTDGKLKTGTATDSYAALQPLGETGLEKITAETPEAVNLLKPRIPKEKKLVTELMDSGPREAEAAPGKTYLLRSAHSGNNDLLIAFQILEKDEDGAVIILWKRLYKGKAPKFNE